MPEGEPITAGTCLVNNHLAVVLFDSGSSHSFMSRAFAQKYNQEITELSTGYCISSVGADHVTKQVVRNVQIAIGDLRFNTHLIVLPGLSMDVILGVSWMKQWGVIVDIANRVILLKNPRDGKEHHLLLPQTIN